MKPGSLHLLPASCTQVQRCLADVARKPVGCPRSVSPDGLSQEAIGIKGFSFWKTGLSEPLQPGVQRLWWSVWGGQAQKFGLAFQAVTSISALHISPNLCALQP